MNTTNLTANTYATSTPNTLPEIVMLDNLDSFTYNLVDEFRCLGYQLTIYRNTLSAEFIFQKLQEKQQSNSAGVILVLSPGPGDPTHAGCLMPLLARCAGKFPILGICLGHQALVQHYGGVIDRAPEVVAIGFQFHPESILTTFGTHLLAQSLSHLSTLANQTIYKVQGHAHDNNCS